MNYNVEDSNMQIQLRKMHLEDADVLFYLTSDQECGKYMKTGQHQMLSQTQDMVHKYCKFPNYGFIIEKENHEVVGYTGLSAMEQQGQYSISIMVFPKFWHGGIATQAVKLTIEFAKNSDMIQGIVAFIVEKNIGSIRVCQKCGFEHIETFEERDRQIGMYQLKVS